MLCCSHQHTTNALCHTDCVQCCPSQYTPVNTRADHALLPRHIPTHGNTHRCWHLVIFMAGRAILGASMHCRPLARFWHTSSSIPEWAKQISSVNVWIVHTVLLGLHPWVKEGRQAGARITVLVAMQHEKGGRGSRRV